MVRLPLWGTPPITHRAEPPTKHPWNPGWPPSRRDSPNRSEPLSAVRFETAILSPADGPLLDGPRTAALDRGLALLLCR